MRTDTQWYLGLSAALANISTRESEGWNVRQVLHIPRGDIFVVVYESDEERLFE